MSNPTSLMTVCAASNCIAAAVLPASPGIFENPASPGYAAALNQDGTPNSPQNPATIGSIMSLFVTGLGGLMPTPLDGSLNPIPFATQNLKAQLQYRSPEPGGSLSPMFAEILYAGPAPRRPYGTATIQVGRLRQGSYREPESIS